MVSVTQIILISIFLVLVLFVYVVFLYFKEKQFHHEVMETLAKEKRIDENTNFAESIEIQRQSVKLQRIATLGFMNDTPTT